jgi:hypothetical protein
MSMEIYVFLNKSDMPSPPDWQRAIVESGFNLQLDLDFDQFTFTGFLPCNLDDRATGFEYYFSPKSDVAAPDTYLAPLAVAFDSVVTFVWGGGTEELVAVIMASASLASSVSSLLHVPEEDSSLPQAHALPYARQQLAQIAAYRK